MQIPVLLSNPLLYFIWRTPSSLTYPSCSTRCMLEDMAEQLLLALTLMLYDEGGAHQHSWHLFVYTLYHVSNTFAGHRDPFFTICVLIPSLHNASKGGCPKWCCEYICPLYLIHGEHGV